MADKSNFNATVEALFKGMDSFVTTKTVVGEAMEVGNVTIVPLADVFFGIGAGSFAGNGKNNDGGGLGGKIRPSALLIIGKDGSTKLVRTDEKEDLVDRILGRAPGIINRFTGGGDKSDAENAEEVVKEAATEAKKAADQAKKAERTAQTILGDEEQA